MQQARAAGQAATLRSQQILLKYGIDPFYGRENLIWAPNWGHADQYAMDVWSALQKADKDVGTMEAIVKTLQKLGKDYVDGKWRP